MAEIIEDFSDNPFDDGWSYSFDNLYEWEKDNIKERSVNYESSNNLINMHQNHQSITSSLAINTTIKTSSPKILPESNDVKVTINGNFSSNFAGSDDFSDSQVSFQIFDYQIIFSYNNSPPSELSSGLGFLVLDPDGGYRFNTYARDTIPEDYPTSFEFNLFFHYIHKNSIALVIKDTTNNNKLVDFNTSSISFPSFNDMNKSFVMRLDNNPGDYRTITNLDLYDININYSLNIKAGNIRQVGDLRPGGSDSEVDIKLAWENPDNVNIDKVSLVRSTNKIPKSSNDGQVVFSTTSTSSGESLSFIDEDLNINSKFFYSVIVEDTDGNTTSDFIIEENSLQINTDTENLNKPPLITDFNAVKKPEFKSILSWTNPIMNDLSEVRIVRRTDTYPSDINDGDIVFQETSPNPGDTDSYSDDQLIPDTVYFYTIFSKRATAGIWNRKVVKESNGGTV
jgi:hypothetical protein